MARTQVGSNKRWSSSPLVDLGAVVLLFGLIMGFLWLTLRP